MSYNIKVRACLQYFATATMQPSLARRALLPKGIHQRPTFAWLPSQLNHFAFFRFPSPPSNSANMLLMLQKWHSHHLEMAMLLDEPPFHRYEPVSSSGEPWRAHAHLSTAARHIDLHGYAWLFVVYHSDPLRTWGQRRVKLTTAGQILREQTHCGLRTGVFTSLNYQVLARGVYANIVGADSAAHCEPIIDARIERDPPDSHTASSPQTSHHQTTRRHDDSISHSDQTSTTRTGARCRGAKTILCRAHVHQHVSHHERPSDGSMSEQVRDASDANAPQLHVHQLLGHAEPQFQSSANMYGEAWLVPKSKHGAVVSILTEAGRCKEDWYVEDGDKYHEKFQFLLTEFQRRPFVSCLLSRLGFVAGATPTVKEALQPHLIKVFQAFEDMRKVTKHARFR